MYMPTPLNKYPGYTGISVLQPGYSYMPVWPTLLYSGQTQPWSIRQKSTLFLLSFQSLDPTGGHSPTLVPEAAEVPQSQLWSLDRFNISSFHYTPALCYKLTIRLYAGPPRIHQPLFLLQKLIRPTPGIFRTELIPRAVTPAHRRDFLEKPSLTVCIKTCNCPATTNGHTM
jgi:hypothetical protein